MNEWNNSNNTTTSANGTFYDDRTYDPVQYPTSIILVGWFMILGVVFCFVAYRIAINRLYSYDVSTLHPCIQFVDSWIITCCRPTCN